MTTEREHNNAPGGRNPDVRGSTSQHLPASDDDTLKEGGSPLQHSTIYIDDWSRTGRGSHVEFSYDEHVPLEQGGQDFLCVSLPLIAYVKAAFLVEELLETFMKLPFKDTSSP
jgi:hypothetical protein